MTTRPIAKAPIAAAPNARAPIATAPADTARIDWAAVRTAGFISTDASDWSRGSFLGGRSMILILLHDAGSCKLRRGAPRNVIGGLTSVNLGTTSSIR